MKYCQKCGNKLDKDVLFCSNCGNEVKKDVRKKKEEIPVYIEPKKGNGKLIAIIIAFALLITAVVVLTILLLTRGSSDSNNDGPIEGEIIGKWEHNLEIKKLGSSTISLYESIEFDKNGKFYFHSSKEGSKEDDVDFDGTYKVDDNNIVLSYAGTDIDVYLKNNELCINEKDCEDYFIKGGTSIKIDYVDTGKNKDENKINICSLMKSEDGYNIDAAYFITNNGKYVSSVNSVETIYSDDSSYLEQLKIYTEDIYKNLNNTYGGYDYKVYIEDNKLIAEVEIDYNKMNLKKYVEDEPDLKEYIENGKFTLEGVEALYEESGAICE